jgi:hypothetical protein
MHNNVKMMMLSLKDDGEVRKTFREIWDALSFTQI